MTESKTLPFKYILDIFADYEAEVSESLNAIKVQGNGEAID